MSALYMARVIYLTFHGEAPITAKLSTGELVDVTIDTETFCNITQTLVQKTLGPVRKALRDAGLTVEEVKGVVMVGGATRMPQVQRAVGEFFRRDPLAKRIGFVINLEARGSAGRVQMSTYRSQGA